MKGYREVDIRPKKETIDVAAAATECIGKGYIRDNQDAVRLRVRIKVSAINLGGGTLTPTLYHAPTADDSVVTTGKTATVNADGDWYLIINESDTSIIPIMPYIEIRMVSTGAATCTIDKCGVMKA